MATNISLTIILHEILNHGLLLSLAAVTIYVSQIVGGYDCDAAYHLVSLLQRQSTMSISVPWPNSPVRSGRRSLRGRPSIIL